MMASSEPKTTTESDHEGEAGENEMIIKHPLQNSWCFWFIKNDRNRDWHENVKKLASFSAVEDFWAMYNFIQPASALSSGCDYCLFKDGIYPAWEDDANKLGGRWLVNINKAQRLECLNRYWLEVLMLLIGEQLEDASDEICGAVVNVRGRGDKLSIWTRRSEKKDHVLKIGSIIKDTLGIQGRGILLYQSHQSAMSKTGSLIKSLYTI
eukprot:m.308722 g.308722  ORF g.308722 m.308722 type:complete len:209 (+) comp44598_c0_seq1:40-666(+)